MTGSIVPKTLFGEKYVSLIIPEDPSSEPHHLGDHDPRTDVSTEVEEVLNDLYPLLTTVQPADLNMTLNALSTALEGRGDAARREPRDGRRLPQARSTRRSPPWSRTSG